MNQLSEMMDCYEHFKTKPFNELIPNEDGESIESLCETDWARILLIRIANEPNSIRIEVEISLPKSVSGHTSKPTSVKPRDSLKEMITHLEYLLALEGFGFKLDLVGEDCLWTASKKTPDLLDEEVFKALIPPSLKD
jgi:hypothetical protein